MKTTLLSIGIVALLFTTAGDTGVSASGLFDTTTSNSSITAGEPVPNVQVTVEQNPPGYKGGRPTDETGSALFANMEAGTYVITLKRFSKAVGPYQVLVKPTHGSHTSVVWDAGKKDSHKLTITLNGDNPQIVDVRVTTADAPATAN